VECLNFYLPSRVLVYLAVDKPILVDFKMKHILRYKTYTNFIDKKRNGRNEAINQPKYIYIAP